MADARQLFRAARLASAIAASGSYDSDAVSRMFEAADMEVKQLLYEKSDAETVSRMFQLPDADTKARDLQKECQMPRQADVTVEELKPAKSA